MKVLHFLEKKLKFKIITGNLTKNGQFINVGIENFIVGIVNV